MQRDKIEKRKAAENKLSSLRKVMEEEKLSGLIFYSSGQLSMLEVNTVLWISGVLPMGPNTGVVLAGSGDPTLIISLPWDEGRVREQSWIEDLRIADRFVAELVIVPPNTLPRFELKARRFFGLRVFNLCPSHGS